jgi:hypothetical protein
MNARIIVATVLLLISSGTIPAIPTVTLGAMEDREKSTPRSFVYKGQVVVHEKNKLIMKDLNGQRMELQLDEDTLIKGRPGSPLKPGDLIEADVTPEGHAKSIRPMR